MDTVDDASHDDNTQHEPEAEADAAPPAAEPIDAVPQPGVAAAMATAEQVIGEHFPDVLDAVKAAVAVAAVGCLVDNAQPTTLIFVAPASAGKSMALGFVMPNEGDPLAAHFYRSDKFTAASFVSHRADVKKDELAKIDLLPRINGRTLITKELAPMFAGKRDELTERFSVLTGVLDGQGYVSDSGAQGRRGYVGVMNFQWLGATTPLSPEVHAVMATLGPRMLFYDADRPRKSTEELVALASRPRGDRAKEACRVAVRDLLVSLYAAYPIHRIVSSSVVLTATQVRLIVLWADVLVHLRAALHHEPVLSAEGISNGAQLVVTLEHPERVLGLLMNFAIGSALAHGRVAVTDYDLAQVAHVALSTGVPGRARVFRALLMTPDGIATTPDVERLTGMSAPSARRYMEELAQVGLVSLTRLGTVRIALVDPYGELVAAPLLKGKRGEGDGDEQC